MSQKINISVCIPTYNGAKYIKQQLDSILMQLGSDDEIIISDDRSTDNTIEIIKSYNDPRIKIFTHKKVTNNYKGTYTNIYYVYKNVENALQQATGDYIFLSDQDDIWLPNKVQQVIVEFEKGADLVLHNNKVVDNELNVLLKSYFDFAKPSHSFVRMIAHCFYQGASVAFRREIADTALPFPSKYIISHDHWIAYCAYTSRVKITFIDEPLLLYRRHGNNVSSNIDQNRNSLYFKLSYRINAVISYFKAVCRR